MEQGTIMKTTMVAIVSFFISTTASAATENSTVAEFKAMGSSSINREGKQFALLVQPFGLGPNLVMTHGVTAGFYTNSKASIEAEMTTGAQIFDGIFFGQFDIKTSSLAVRYKYFAWNTLYFKGGINQRHISFSEKMNNFLFTGQTVTQKFEGDVTALEISIGNQWQWSHFTVGIDWFGYSLPVSSRVTSRKIEGSTDETRFSTLEGPEKRYLESGSLTAFNFYLGASW
jgi:hypothetical protein